MVLKDDFSWKAMPQGSPPSQSTLLRASVGSDTLPLVPVCTSVKWCTPTPNCQPHRVLGCKGRRQTEGVYHDKRYNRVIRVVARYSCSVSKLKEQPCIWWKRKVKGPTTAWEVWACRSLVAHVLTWAGRGHANLPQFSEVSGITGVGRERLD